MHAALLSAAVAISLAVGGGSSRAVTNDELAYGGVLKAYEQVRPIAPPRTLPIQTDLDSKTTRS